MCIPYTKCLNPPLTILIRFNSTEIYIVAYLIKIPNTFGQRRADIS